MWHGYLSGYDKGHFVREKNGTVNFKNTRKVFCERTKVRAPDNVIHACQNHAI